MNESTELADADAGDGDESTERLHIDEAVYGYPKALARYREEPHLVGTTLYRCEVKLGPGTKWRPFVFNPSLSRTGRRGIFSNEDDMVRFLDEVVTHLRTPRPNPTRWKLHAPQADAIETDVDATETDAEVE